MQGILAWGASDTVTKILRPTQAKISTKLSDS